MSTISAGTTSTTAFKVTGDTTGTLQLQTGATPTTAIDISASQVVSFPATTTLSFSGSLTLPGQTANGVAYLNGSKVLTSGSALTFDGTNLTIGTNPSNLYFGSSSGSYIKGTNSGGYLIFGYGASEYGRFDGSGNLGIGTSSPGAKLDVVGNGKFSGSGVKTLTVTSSDNNASVIASAGNGATGGFRLNNSSGTQHWNIYETFGAAGQQGNLGIYNEVSAATQLTLDTSGNLGLGVTPSAWRGSEKAIQFGTVGAVSCYSNLTSNLRLNSYIDSGGTERYIANGPAQIFGLYNGAFNWSTAGSGTAGSAISFSQVMTLDSDGGLYLNKSYGGGGTSAAALRVNLNSGIGGGYFEGYSNDTWHSHNCEFISGSGWVARNSFATRFEQNNGTFYWYSNGGLTAGSAFTPTLRMSLDTGGNLVMPWSDTKIHWYYDGSYSGGLQFTTSTRKLDVFSKASDGTSTITFSTGTSPSERARIDSNGNWMVGVTSINSGNKAQINGDLLLGPNVFGTGQSYTLALGDNNAFLKTAYGDYVIIGAYNGIKFGRATASDKTLSAEWSRINSGGDFEWSDNGAVGYSAMRWIRNGGSGTANSGRFNLAYVTVNWTPGSTPNTLYWDGNTGSVTILTSSAKYKRNITAVTDEQLDKALALKPSYYQRNEYDYWEYGFIAEEVEEAGLDEIVSKVEGEVSGLDYQKLTVFCIGLIQRQDKAIKELTARLAALEAK